MDSSKPDLQSELRNYRYWARKTFVENRQAVAYVETRGTDERIGIGTSFHVGEGSFVTARHVVENREVTKIGFDDFDSSFVPIQWDNDDFWSPDVHEPISLVDGPYFHSDSSIDVACFRISRTPRQTIELGAHLDDFMAKFELVTHRILVMGYPKIPFANRPTLMAAVGEINALIDKYTGGHPHFVISTMARGGLSGAPVLVAYDETNELGGTAALGLVAESLLEGDLATELGYSAVLTVEPIYQVLEEHGLLPKSQKITFDDEGNML